MLLRVAFACFNIEIKFQDFLGHFPGLIKALSTYVSVTGLGITCTLVVLGGG